MFVFIVDIECSGAAGQDQSGCHLIVAGDNLLIPVLAVPQAATSAVILFLAHLGDGIPLFLSGGGHCHLLALFPRDRGRVHRALVAFSVPGNRHDIPGFHAPVREGIRFQRMVLRCVMKPLVNRVQGSTADIVCHLSSPPSVVDCPGLNMLRLRTRRSFPCNPAYRGYKVLKPSLSCTSTD